MAAAVSGVFPVCLDQQRACAEDGEMQKKQVALMEKLRSKRTSQHRSWTDSLMKSIRTTVVDRKLQADSGERNQVQKCLYTLQRAMKVISQQSLLERLETVARHQGLTFGVNGSDPPNITLQADMFHIEIALNKGGGVREVKIAHQGDASVCHELTDILSRGDFPEFTSHLEGLQSIYGVTGEKKLKSKVFLALQSLEKDLNDLAQFQSSISGVANYIHMSPLGILLPRTAGKPMKLIYFVSPYDLLDKKTMSAHPMTVEAITEHGLGRSVTVCLEPGPPNKLQTMPLLSVTKNLPSFNGLTHANSAHLPACFVLVLPQPIPVAMSIIHSIHELTKLDMGKENCSQPLLSLILDSNSGGKIKNDHQLFVSLPDQHHRYFINGVSGGVLEQPGVMLSRIPFTHPTHVPKILNLLRQQLLFNSLMASCVRPAAKKDNASSLVFELTVISLKQMMVVFEHPAHDTMVTVDIDMSEMTVLKCRMLGGDHEHSLCTDDYASLVLQRCLSLPVLLRSLVRKGRSQLEKLMVEAQALAEEQARRAQEAALWAAAQLRQQQQQARLPTNIPTKGRPPPPQPPPRQLTPTYPPTPSPITSNPPSVGDLRGMGGGVDLLSSSPPGYPAMMGGGGEGQDKQNNPLLVNLLDNPNHSATHTTSSQASSSSSTPSSSAMQVTESPMLSKLLEDNISVATNITPIASMPSTLHQPHPKPKTSKGRKRRSQSELPAGRSPKHRISDSDANERFGSLDFESSSSPLESSLGGSGNLTGFHHPMGPTSSRPPSQGMSGVIDLTEENNSESNLKKLVDFSMESMPPPKDMRAGGGTPDSELHSLLNQQDHGNSPSTASLKPNQVTGSKNENASTSPEGFLTGSGEVGKASLPDPAAAHPKVPTSASRASPPAALAAFLGHGPAPPAKGRRDVEVGVGVQPFPQQGDFTATSQPFPSMDAIGMGVSAGPVARPKVVSSGSMTDMLDIKPSMPVTKKGGGAAMKVSASVDCVSDKRGLFERFDFTGQTAPAPTVTITSSTVPATAGLVEGEDQGAPKVLKLKLHPFRAPQGKSQSLDSGVVQSPSSAGSKSSNSNTFDFRSDEEDDDPMPLNYVPPDRLSVYSSSPTRLQISSKGKPPTPVSISDSPPPMKPEKYKRKDKSSGNTKRKKDRDESKKERKKKKFDHDLYMPTGKEPVYRASTIEGDQKSGTKLKIRVSKEPIPTKESSRVELNPEKAGKFSERVNDVLKRRSASSSPTVEKLVLQKQDIRDQSLAGKLVLQKQDIRDQSLAGLEGGKNRDAAQLYRSALSASAKPSSLKTGGSSKGASAGNNSPLSKADPKLAKATIRLKPLNITSSSTSSSVTVTPPVKTVSSGRGTSDRSERRSQSMSTSTSVSTSTSSTLSLASILPNAPTASSVASLPPIPKRPKVTTVNTATTTTTTTTSKTSPAVTINSSSKNSPINSGYNHSVNKMSTSPSLGGGRTGSSPATPNLLKTSSGMSFNKTGGPPVGILKTSPNTAGHKAQKNTSMPQGILKNSGNVGQGSANALKTSATGNPTGQKGSGGSSQFNNTYSRGPNSASLSGGPQKVTVPGHGVTKTSGQGGGAFKGSGLQGNLSRGSVSGGFQRGTAPSQGGILKPSSAGSQGEVSSQSAGPQKGMQMGKAQGGGSTSMVHRSLAQGGPGCQGNSTSVTSKPLNSLTAASGPGQSQKLPSGQTRSLSTGSCNSSPSGPNRPVTSVRNNSSSGGGGGSRAPPPNHLPISRSAGTPVQGQKAASGSSPRTPSHHSPSNPVGPRFPGQSPQQKNSGSSPSGVSQRSGSSVQTPSQRSSSTPSHGGGVNPRSSSTAQRTPSSGQTSRLPSHSSGSSPTQRPASTPGLATDARPPAAGSGPTPGYPGRPSSAGPRQGSSPVAGSKGTSSPGQRHSSSPSGSRTSSPGAQSQRSGVTGSGVSPLASRHSPGGGSSDPAPLLRQNSSGSLNSSLVSRQNSASSSSNAVVSRAPSSGGQSTIAVSKASSAGSGSPAATSRQPASAQVNSVGVSRQTSASSVSTVAAVSRQTSTHNSSPTVASRPSSTSSVSASAESQQQMSSAKSSATALSRQNSTGNVNPSSVFRHSSDGGGGNSTVTGKQSSNANSKSVTTSSGVCRSSPTSVSAATWRQTAGVSGAMSTSGKPQSAGSSIVSSTALSSLSSAAPCTTTTASAQRTSAGSSIVSGGEGGGGRGGNSKTGTSAASGPKLASAEGSTVGKGASLAKVSPSSVTDAKTSGPDPGGSAGMDSGSSAGSGGKGEAGYNTVSATSSVSSAAARTQSALSTAPLVKSTVSSSSASAKIAPASSAAMSTVVSSTSSKSIMAGAVRGRKGSLSAIVDKLTTRVVASSGPAADSSEAVGSSGDAPSMGSVGELSAERRKSVAEEWDDQRTGVKRSASLSGLSPPSSQQKVQRVDCHKVPSSSSCTASSTSSTPLPAHTPPHSSSALSLDPRPSRSLGEGSSPSLSRDCSSVGLDLTVPKDKGRPDSMAAPTSAPMPPPPSDSRGGVSPKEPHIARSGSPAVGQEKGLGGGTKFNGDSSKDKWRGESEVFKVPTPKTQAGEEEERGGGGGGGGSRGSPVCGGGGGGRSVAAPVSPLSDASSPGNELIIDCGESPTVPNARLAHPRSGTAAPVQPSPKRVADLAAEGGGGGGGGGIENVSPVSSTGKASPGGSGGGMKNSPHTALLTKPSPGHTSPEPSAPEAAANSPCEIDDDLMDAALMGFNAS